MDLFSTIYICPSRSIIGLCRPGAVMVETQDALAFGSDAYHVEGHALADGGQVEHIAVGGEERQVVRFQETPDAGCRVMDG